MKARKPIAIFGVTLTLLGMIFGTLVPLRAAFVMRQSFDELKGGISLTQFKVIYSRMLRVARPVGEMGALLRLISSVDEAVKGGLSMQGAEDLIRFTEAYTTSYLTAGATHYVDSRLVWAIATLYHDAGALFRNQKYLDRAEEWYQLGLGESPTRPQFLYGLFNLYESEGRKEDAQRIGEVILRLWPSDRETHRRLTSERVL